MSKEMTEQVDIEVGMTLQKSAIQHIYSSSSGPVPEHIVYSPQEGWYIQTSCQLEAVSPLSSSILSGPAEGQECNLQTH